MIAVEGDVIQMTMELRQDALGAFQHIREKNAYLSCHVSQILACVLLVYRNLTTETDGDWTFPTIET